MTIWLWIGFIAIIGVMLAIDLGVFHRKAHTVKVSEAAIWTGVWVAMSLLFNVAVYFIYEHHIFGIGTGEGHTETGRQAALEFFTGYLIEKSLSLDNIFVIALIFVYFGTPSQHQHRVLFWGILGAVVMRGAMIAIGAVLVHRFTWITYVFGGLLLLTAIKLLATQRESVEPEKNLFVKVARRIFPVSNHLDGPHFFTRIDGKRAITPLFLVLLVVESTDVIFAVDSIPAIFAVTYDPFIVFTSNVCAILGLRSLYFVLAGVIQKFKYMKFSLVVLLAFVGVKLLLAHHFPIPTYISLAIICGILIVGVLASISASARGGMPLAKDVEDLAAYSWKRVRRVVIIILGISVIIVGIIMLITPGPAFVVIPAGLAILSTEFIWAKRLLAKLKLRRGEEDGGKPESPAEPDGERQPDIT